MLTHPASRYWRIFLLLALLILAASPLTEAGEERCFITGFEEEHAPHINDWMNSKGELVAASADERLPEGRRCLRITLGGLTAHQGGGVSIRLPDNVLANACAVSFWLRGRKENQFGPAVLLGEYWSWRDTPGEAQAKLDATDDGWVRYELKLSEFVARKKNDEAFTDSRYLCFALGKMQDYPTSIVFDIDKLEILTKPTATATVAPLPTPTQEDAKMRTPYLRNAFIGALLAATVAAAAEPAETTAIQQSETLLRASQEALDSRGIVILPTPKSVTFTGEDESLALVGLAGKVRLVGNDEIAVEWIRRRLLELGAPEPELMPVAEWKPAAGMIDLLLFDRETKELAAYLPAELPKQPQGYGIAVTPQEDGKIYTLAGSDRQGMLYAAVTFAKLLREKNGRLLFPQVAVRDWADVSLRCSGGIEWAYRRRFMWKNAKDSDEVKRYIDWALAHKINLLWGQTTHGNKDITNDPRLFTPDQKAWMREVNDYAAARGIRVILPQTWAVGSERLDGDKPEFKDCVNHLGEFYTWANDGLLRRKVEALSKFLDETGFGGVYFHSIDTRNSRWEDRGQLEMERFGEDRVAGDANVINHLYELRKTHPDLLISFVPRPYVGNLLKPEPLLEKHEMRLPDDMRRFSSQVPSDVFVCHRECSPEENESWRVTFKQPRLMYVTSAYGIVRLTGNFFKPYFRYCRTWFAPGGNDLMFWCGGWRKDDVSNLGSVEYSWNLYAPGAKVFDVPDRYQSIEERHRVTVRDLWDPFPTPEANPGLRAFVRRACVDLYGIEHGARFEPLFLSAINPEYVSDMKAKLAAWHTNDGLQKSDANIKFTYAECADFMARNSREISQAISSLEALPLESLTPYARGARTWFLSQLYPVRAGADTMALALAAEEASRRGEHTETDALLAAAEKAFQQGNAALARKWPRLLAEPSIRPIPDKVPDLTKIRNQLDLIRVRSQSRFEVPVAQPVEPVPSKRNAPVRVALYDPRSSKGQVYGVDGLRLLLENQLDVALTLTDDLSLENLKNFDCVIIPDCKRFGEKAVNVAELRAYVTEHGGGVYFEHDSCGFHRSAFSQSVFPEVGEVAERIGVSTSRDLRAGEAERQLVIAAEHPVSVGNPVGLRFTQSYFDHFRLQPGVRGVALLHDAGAQPVLLAGEIGGGRVIYNGAITYGADDRELDHPLAGIEGECIVNAVHWLARQPGAEIRLEEMRKSDEVHPDGTYSVFSLRPVIIPSSDLTDVTLSTVCQDAVTLRQLEKEQTLATIPHLAGEWRSEEPLTFKVPQCECIRLALIIRAGDKEKRLTVLAK
jgi:hypothetical protein